VLDPQRVRHARAREQLTPAALGAQVGERGIGPLDRQVELLRERGLELRAHVGDQAGGLVVGDRPADAGEQRRPLEQLGAQRSDRRVLGAEHRQPLARARPQLGGEQPEVVVDDRLGHRRGRHIHHMDARIAQ
jgi:hypothetical protein